MFKYKLEDINNNTNITKIINAFKRHDLPRFHRLERYYQNINKNKQQWKREGEPDNKLAHGFAKYITNMATSYFMGKNVTYDIEDTALKGLITDVLEFNYTDDNHFEIAKEASKKGVAYEVLYVDEQNRFKTERLKAEEVIPIYSPTIGNFLECAIRLWKETDINGNKSHYAALYTENEVYYYRQSSSGGSYIFERSEAHFMGDIPIIIYWNNEEQTSDFENVTCLIDAYDQSQSDTANDSEYFANAYLTIAGALGGIQSADSTDGTDGEDSEEKAIKSMRKHRIIYMDENGQVQWLTKNVNDTAIENYKKRMQNDIFLFAQVPAMSDESFAGNLSGVAIRYKLVGLEQLSIMKENKFRAALKKKLLMITEFVQMMSAESFNPPGIKIKFARNFIDNLSETIENVAKLEGIVSKKTQLTQLPFIEDADAELKQIEAERQADEGLAKIPPNALRGIFDNDNGSDD